MSWTDLFKPKSKPAADPRIRWFGKLPTYADYYTSGGDEAWAVGFTDWLLKGIEVYSGRLETVRNAPEQLPIGACALRLQGSAMTVLASILDFGGDATGGRRRKVPMCFYVGVPTEQWPGPVSGNAISALRVLRQLTDLRKDIGRFLNFPMDFRSLFQDRNVEMDGLGDLGSSETWREQARQIRFTDWFERVKPALKTRNAEQWLQLATVWGANIAKCENRDFQPTLRFPLAAGLSLEVQVAGWLRWLEERMDLKRRSLSVFLTGDLGEGVGAMSVVARPPLPDDFLVTTTLSRTLAYVDDLADVSSKAPTDQEVDVLAEPSLASETVEGDWLTFVTKPLQVSVGLT